jgi:DivIVA domain-containing protein
LTLRTSTDKEQQNGAAAGPAEVLLIGERDTLDWWRTTAGEVGLAGRLPATTKLGTLFGHTARMRARPAFGMMPWMANGDSRSIYIVQRTFTRVRRGYDPREVDRDLQRVSEWFARSRVGEAARALEHREAAAKGAQLEAEATL